MKWKVFYCKNYGLLREEGKYGCLLRIVSEKHETGSLYVNKNWKKKFSKRPFLEVKAGILCLII